MTDTTQLPQVLVSGYHTGLEESALLLVDLNEGTYRPFLPYPAPIYATADTLYVARFLGAGTRLEKYDRDGLAWMCRLHQCVDTHSVIEHGDGLAVCSTGTNEVLFLDRDGVERRRWSPDEDAESDSWHLNSLTRCGSRLAVSCFGAFDEFRGWCGNLEGAGLVLDVETGRPLLSGITAPHDPHRLGDGWLLNESGNARTIYVPDGGPIEVIAEWPGFPRGLLVLPELYVIGVSRPRTEADRTGQATLHLVDRREHRVLRSIRLPYPEIGHIIAVPGPEVLDAVQRQQHEAPACLLPERRAIAPSDRAGSLVALEPLRPVDGQPKVFRTRIRISNHSSTVWASENELPVRVSFQLLDAAGDVICPEAPRTRMPVPLGPGRSLSFPIDLNLSLGWHMPATAVRITLVQEKVDWWQPSERWEPATVPFPQLRIANCGLRITKTAAQPAG